MTTMQKLYQYLKTTLWCVIGVFAGICIYQTYEYRTSPGLYDLASTPWYLNIQTTGTIVEVIVVILLIAMWIVRRMDK